MVAGILTADRSIAHRAIAFALLTVCVLAALVQTRLKGEDSGQVLLEVLSAAAPMVTGNLATRAEVHQQPGLPHRGIWMVIVSNQMEVLMMSRSSHSATCAGAWEFVHDEPLPGENWDGAVRRSLASEAGFAYSLRTGTAPPYSLEHLQPAAAMVDMQFSTPSKRGWGYSFTRDRQWTEFYLVKLSGRPHAVPKEGSHNGYIWVPLAQWQLWFEDVTPSTVLCPDLTYVAVNGRPLQTLGLLMTSLIDKAQRVLGVAPAKIYTFEQKG